MATNDAGVPHIPVLTPEGQSILNITKAQDFNSEYRRALVHLADTWCADKNAKPIQCHAELGNDTPGMTAYAAANVVSTRRATLLMSQTSHRVRSKFTTAPLDNLPESHKLRGYNVHFDFSIPSGSPLQSHTFHKEADLEELLGMTDRQKTRTSTAIVTQTDVIDLPNIKEMISNGA